MWCCHCGGAGKYGAAARRLEGVAEQTENDVGWSSWERSTLQPACVYLLTYLLLDVTQALIAESHDVLLVKSWSSDSIILCRIESQTKPWTDRQMSIFFCFHFQLCFGIFVLSAYISACGRCSAISQAKAAALPACAIVVLPLYMQPATNYESWIDYLVVLQASINS